VGHPVSIDARVVIVASLMRSGLSIGTGSVAVTLGIEALECTCTPIPAGLLAVGS
jgi:hypothetical protein